MASIEADQCFLSAVVRSYLSWSIEWLLMNVAAVQDSTSSDSVQPVPAVWQRRSLGVASRTIIGTLVKQIRVLLVPVLHGLRSPF